MLMSVANKMNLHYNILQYLRGTFHVGSNIHIYIHGWLMIISYRHSLSDYSIGANSLGQETTYVPQINA